MTSETTIQVAVYYRNSDGFHVIGEVTVDEHLRRVDNNIARSEYRFQSFLWINSDREIRAAPKAKLYYWEGRQQFYRDVYLNRLCQVLYLNCDTIEQTERLLLLENGIELIKLIDSLPKTRFKDRNPWNCTSKNLLSTQNPRNLSKSLLKDIPTNAMPFNVPTYEEHCREVRLGRYGPQDEPKEVRQARRQLAIQQSIERSKAEGQEPSKTTEIYKGIEITGSSNEPPPSMDEMLLLNNPAGLGTIKTDLTPEQKEAQQKLAHEVLGEKKPLPTDNPPPITPCQGQNASNKNNNRDSTDNKEKV